MPEINLLLKLLQDAGYEVAQLEIELGVTPAIAIHLGIGSAVSDVKLKASLQAHQDKATIAMVLTALLQANKLRDSITIEGLAAVAVIIILATLPRVALQWKGTVATG